MRLDIYVNYCGTCEQAFRFYEQHLGGRITGIVRHGEQPNPALLRSRSTWPRVSSRLYASSMVIQRAYQRDNLAGRLETRLPCRRIERRQVTLLWIL